MNETLRLLKALSDSTRLRILMMLKTKTLCVCEIAAVLDLSQPTISRHLKQLQEASLIIQEKDGKWVNVHLNKELKEDSIQYIIFNQIHHRLEDDSLIRKDGEKVNTVSRYSLCGLPPAGGNEVRDDFDTIL